MTSLPILSQLKANFPGKRDLIIDILHAKIGIVGYRMTPGAIDIVFARVHSSVKDTFLPILSFLFFTYTIRNVNN